MLHYKARTALVQLHYNALQLAKRSKERKSRDVTVFRRDRGHVVLKVRKVSRECNPVVLTLFPRFELSTVRKH